MSNRGIRIISAGSALPARCVTNDDLSKVMETSDEWIRSRSGIGSRQYCGEGESCLTLAAEAGRRAMRNGGVSPEEIRVIIAATSSGDYIVPSMAAMVQKELGIPEEVTAFDLGAGCTGFVLALAAARGILLGMEAEEKTGRSTEALGGTRNIEVPKALVIGCEQLSSLLDHDDRGTAILFGDGAGAAVISLSDGLFCQKSWSRGDDHALRLSGVGRPDQHIRMQGQEVFRFAVHALKQGIDEVLSETGLTMEDIDYVLCHQANARIIDHTARQYPGSAEKFLMNIETRGNTSAASVPILLSEAV
ncbi:MAG: 3-oxoacyl-ACP synthase, partial [Stomatobaculum sp.]|nr:3-oxoacyl-ACP synthase [Stomatobaculum sp.]